MSKKQDPIQLEIDKQVNHLTLLSYSWREMKSTDLVVVLFLIVAFRKLPSLENTLHQNKENSCDSLIKECYAGGMIPDDVISQFVPTLEGLQRNSFKQLLESVIALQSVDVELPVLFERVLERLVVFSGREMATYSQPTWLTDFMIDLALQYQPKTVYNPFAGTAAFGAKLPCSRYIGQEINPTAWAIGQLRLVAAEKDLEVTQLRKEDVFTSRIFDSTFDMVISNPPFGYKNPGWYDLNAKMNLSEHYLLGKSMELLSDDGVLIVTTTNSFLRSNRSEDKEVKKRLLDSKYLEAVINFQEGLLKQTRLDFAVLVLRKNRQSGEVLMMDSLYNGLKIRHGAVSVSSDSLLKTYSAALKGEDVKQCRLKQPDELLNGNLDLRVLPNLLDRPEGVPLGDIVKYIPGESAIPNKGDILIQAHHLRMHSRNMYPQVLSINDVGRSSGNEKGYRRISQSCVLIGLAGTYIAPVLLEVDSNYPVYIGQRILAYEPDASIVDDRYLVNKLEHPDVLAQVRDLKASAFMALSKVELESLIVETPPSLDEQYEYVEGLLWGEQETQDYSRAFITRRDEKIKEGYSGLASLKHALATPAMGIGRSLRILEKELDRWNKQWRSHSTLGSENKTLVDILKNIELELKHIDRIVSTSDDDFEPEKFKLIELDGSGVFKRLLTMIENMAGSEVLVLSKDARLFLESNEVPIVANEDLLKIVFTALVENAKRHAFSETDQMKILSVDLSFEIKQPIYWGYDSINANILYDLSDTNYLKVSIANTGHPFPAGFGLNEFVRPKWKTGQHGNTGYGGFHIGRIIRYFNNGSLNMRLNDSPDKNGMTTVIEFLVPLA